MAVVLAVGRERMFRVVARRFEGSNPRMRQDGAFLASLLDDASQVKVGQQWFMHLDEGEKDFSYEPHEQEHHWRYCCLLLL